MRQLMMILLVYCSLIKLQAQEVPAKISQVLHIINNYHVNPPPIDDSLSKKIFSQIIQIIDPNKILFTSDNIYELKAFEYLLDDELKGTSINFLTTLENILQLRAPIVGQKIEKILQVPFSFENNEEITVNPINDLNSFSPENNYDIWLTKWLKWQVLKQMAMPEINDSIHAIEIKYKDQTVARKQVLLTLKRQLESIHQINNQSDYLVEIFLKSLALSCDPHTNYFTNSELKGFEASLSAENLSFGFAIDENLQGDVEIVKLKPGSPAWKSNKLNAGDILLSIQWQDEKETDLSGLGIETTQEILTRPDKFKINIKVRKRNGTIAEVTLLKAKLAADENIVKGYVLTGERKVGYISLPDFYTEFENIVPLGCANDIAKEIIKLNKEKTEGIIIDLRDNGGGSMKEAIDLSGIFIDYGPVAMVQDKSGTTTIIKDLNRGSIYTGPLIILINNQSASASEVFAGAMQDYNRAIIVGEQSFGKATSQIILPCDSTQIQNGRPSTAHKSGYLKVTTNKIFNIKGTSHQHVGIIPDIPLTNNQAYIYSEATLSNSLMVGSTSKQSYFKPMPALPIEELKNKRYTRTEDKTKRLLGDSSLKIVNGQKFIVPLKIDAYEKLLINLYSQLYGSATGESKNLLFKANGTEFDHRLINFSNDTKEIYTTYFNAIESDKQIQEAYKTMIDYISIIQKP